MFDRIEAQIHILEDFEACQQLAPSRDKHRATWIHIVCRGDYYSDRRRAWSYAERERERLRDRVRAAIERDARAARQRARYAAMTPEQREKRNVAKRAARARQTK